MLYFLHQNIIFTTHLPKEMYLKTHRIAKIYIAVLGKYNQKALPIT